MRARLPRPRAPRVKGLHGEEREDGGPHRLSVGAVPELAPRRRRRPRIVIGKIGICRVGCVGVARVGPVVRERARALARDRQPRRDRRRGPPRRPRGDAARSAVVRGRGLVRAESAKATRGLAMGEAETRGRVGTRGSTSSRVVRAVFIIVGGGGGVHGHVLHVLHDDPHPRLLAARLAREFRPVVVVQIVPRRAQQRSLQAVDLVPAAVSTAPRASGAAAATRHPARALRVCESPCFPTRDHLSFPFLWVPNFCSRNHRLHDPHHTACVKFSRTFAEHDLLGGISIVAGLHCSQGMWQTVRDVSFSIRT